MKDIFPEWKRWTGSKGGEKGRGNMLACPCPVEQFSFWSEFPGNLHRTWPKG